MVRVREAIRYLSPKKLEIFVKVPFLLHINCPGYPGFVDTKDDAPCGIWNFKNSGFYKEGIKSEFFSELIVKEHTNNPAAILGLYHIGSIGTFTQSMGSDFDYWVIIDKKKFSWKRYDQLEKKLDAVLKYCRESYDQKVSFFIMDQREIKHNRYAPFKDEESLTVPKIFLKEEFYRTFLMIAGKIPLWSILPGLDELESMETWNADGITAQVLSMYDDLIDLGQIDFIPIEDVVKGILWHICKSKADPIKAVIKATMVFSYGFGRILPKILLCEKIKKGYSKAGIDDYGVDPYKALFDQILKFHELEDPKGLSLIKNAVFFRLCGYPDVKPPDENTPKRQLLDRYIRIWKLNKKQIKKLLSYSEWSESEKLILEKTYIQRLAHMYNYAIKKTGKIKFSVDKKSEKRNWLLLKNKTRERLRKDDKKIPECSTYLKRRDISRLDIIKKTDLWELNIHIKNGQEIDKIYSSPHFFGVFGWILENQLYRRQKASILLHGKLSLFESTDKPITADALYMAFQPLKPLSDTCYENKALWLKMRILLFYESYAIIKAEFLISNSWGELFLDIMEFATNSDRQMQCSQMADFMLNYTDKNLRLSIYQYSDTHDPDIVYQLKKAYNNLLFGDDNGVEDIQERPYLDKL